MKTVQETERSRSQSATVSAVQVMQIATGQVEEERSQPSRLAEYIQQGLLGEEDQEEE